MDNGFDRLPLKQALLDRLKERGIERPTAVQAEAIPAVLEGRDVVARSQTGTGKTLAFLLPILERLDPGSKKLQALIIVPTQELGMQILRESEAFGEALGIRCQALIGGAALSRQVDKLKLHPQLAVGTPGRVLELLRMRKLSLQEVSTVVIDEVDQVFALGGASDVESILHQAGRRRQLLFFSATIPDDLRRQAQRWMKEPLWLQVEPQHVAAETLEHLFVTCDEREKIDMLRRLVLNLKPKAALVFLNETEDAAEVEAKLAYGGLSIGSIYGDAGKQDRSRMMQAFRAGKLQLLLATDVAARGLDLPEVTHVFNLDVPGGVDPYVHRAGRTGRMGRPGTVITLVMPRQRFIMNKFAKALGVPIHERTLYGGKLVAPQEGGGRQAGPEGDFRRPKAGSAADGRKSIGKSPSAVKAPEASKDQAAGNGPGNGKGGASGKAPAMPVHSAVPARATRSTRSSGPAQSRTDKPARAPIDRQRPADGAGGNPRRSARSGQDAKPGKPAGVRSEPYAAKGKEAAAGKPKERARDRKNKGAPRWLKEKRQADGNDKRESDPTS